MIKFNNLNQQIPYLLFKAKHDEAVDAGQKSIEAISISTYNTQLNEVDSRYVNLKFVSNNEFIFFSNYNSPKAAAFSSNNQIAVLVYWSMINLQIRMKARIRKTSNEYNQSYFSTRTKEKNALAISSNQSKIIDSFDAVQRKFNKSLKKDDLKICPKSWGGYAFSPYEIEFWEGNNFRLNKRNLYKKNNERWDHYILEP